MDVKSLRDTAALVRGIGHAKNAAAASFWNANAEIIEDAADALERPSLSPPGGGAGRTPPERFKAGAWAEYAALSTQPSQTSGEDVERLMQTADALLTACYRADEDGELPDHIDGDTMQALDIAIQAMEVAALSAQPTPIQAGGDVVGALEWSSALPTRRPPEPGSSDP